MRILLTGLAFSSLFLGAAGAAPPHTHGQPYQSVPYSGTPTAPMSNKSRAKLAKYQKMEEQAIAKDRKAAELMQERSEADRGKKRKSDKTAVDNTPHLAQ